MNKTKQRKCSRCKKIKAIHLFYDELGALRKRCQECQLKVRIHNLKRTKKNPFSRIDIPNVCTRCERVKGVNDREYTDGLCADCYLSDYANDTVTVDDLEHFGSQISLFESI